MLDPLLASKWGHLVDPLPTTLDPNLNLIKATRCHNDGRIRTQAARIASEFFIHNTIAIRAQYLHQLHGPESVRAEIFRDPVINDWCNAALQRAGIAE